LEEQSRMLNSVKLKALQAQINPHFLFNALNTVVSLVRTKPETARELLIELGEFFRNNLKHGEDFVTLKQELHYVQSYLAIELARFGEKIQVQFDIEKNSYYNKVPALLLQPLVENAIKHGILPQKGGGKIIIGAKSQDGGMQVSIEDNGVGMNSNKIDKLFQEESHSSTGIGIGLINVNERLKSIYGSEAALKIASIPGVGTVMSFSIPLNISQGRDENVGAKELRVVLVDDEKPAMDEIEYLLAEIPGIKICGQADSGEAALEIIMATKHDVVFLDIQMYDLSGFTVAEKLLETKNAPLIIFVTAYEDYAVNAFEIRADFQLLCSF